MKTIVILITSLVASLTTAQDRSFRYGINEDVYAYADNYSPPENIEFVFIGDLKYVKYFYTNLEKEILNVFNKKTIQIAFRYLDNKVHYNSKTTSDKTKTIYYLNIYESNIIKEHLGFNRIVSFNFSGKLINAEDLSERFSFKSTVIAIHDINQQNKDVANYLFSRLYYY